MRKLVNVLTALVGFLFTVPVWGPQVIAITEKIFVSKWISLMAGLILIAVVILLFMSSKPKNHSNIN